MEATGSSHSISITWRKKATQRIKNIDTHWERGEDQSGNQNNNLWTHCNLCWRGRSDSDAWQHHVMKISTSMHNAGHSLSTEPSPLDSQTLLSFFKKKHYQRILVVCVSHHGKKGDSDILLSTQKWVVLTLDLSPKGSRNYSAMLNELKEEMDRRIDRYTEDCVLQSIDLPATLATGGCLHSLNLS